MPAETTAAKSGQAGHRQRLRQKFEQSGLSGFHDYEVIELLLTLATPRRDCKAAAKAALDKFKTLQGVLEASSKALLQIDGIGPKNQFGLHLIKAVADRYLEKKLVGATVLGNSTDLFNYLNHTIRDRHRECFVVIFLNAKNQVLDTDTMFEGSLTSSAVYPREVVKAAMDHHAAALIFAHNHPSGDPSPSNDDIAITRRLVFACRVMGVNVHEHLVIGDQRYFSFADHGYISQMNRDWQRLAEGM